MLKAVAVSKYNKLVADISGLYENAKKVLAETYWQIGQRIVEVEQDGEVRAHYGDGLLQSISDDLSKKFGKGFSVRNLERMRGFYLKFPKSTTSSKLDWSKYVALLPLEDQEKRERLEKRAAKEKLPVREIRKLVQEENGSLPQPASKKLPPLKRPTDLKLDTFSEAGGNELDCGFCVFRSVSKEELASVTLTDKPSYTYAATVERVVDGDTLLVRIDLGFGTAIEERLRLRGVNSPELSTPEGEKAKAYVESFLSPGTVVVIKSYKSKKDIYGRFVVDVFYFGGDSRQNILRQPGAQQGAGAEGSVTNSLPEEIIASGEYLNQGLLDKGFAVRMDA